MDYSGLVFALVGALVGGYLSFIAGERSVFSRSVIDERAKWRDRIRSLTISAVKAISDGNKSEIDRVHAELCLRLNPEDDEDRLILDNLKKDCKKSTPEDVTKFLGRISYLLKHDWERAKIEASS